MLSWLPVLHDLLAVLDQIFPFYIYWYLHKLATRADERITRLDERISAERDRNRDIENRLEGQIVSLNGQTYRIMQRIKKRRRSGRKHSREPYNEH